MSDTFIIAARIRMSRAKLQGFLDSGPKPLQDVAGHAQALLGSPPRAAELGRAAAGATVREALGALAGDDAGHFVCRYHSELGSLLVYRSTLGRGDDDLAVLAMLAGAARFKAKGKVDWALYLAEPTGRLYLPGTLAVVRIADDGARFVSQPPPSGRLEKFFAPLEPVIEAGPSDEDLQLLHRPKQQGGRATSKKPRTNRGSKQDPWKACEKLLRICRRLHGKGDAEAVLRTATEALAHVDNHAETWTYYIWGMRALGKEDALVAELAEKWRLVESDRTLMLNFTAVLNDNHRYEKSMQIIERFEQLAGRVPDDAWVNIVNTHIGLQDWDGARRRIDQGMAAMPDSPVLFWALAEVEAQAGNADAALEAVERVRKRAERGFPMSDLRDDPLLAPLAKDRRFKTLTR